jgi:RNA polymerase sigma-70 factor (ECF subfamily)
LYRAREKIRAERISLEAPLPASLPGRLDAVLHTLYLLFNEGYNSSHPDQLIRHDLCEEAMRLSLLLTRNAVTCVADAEALLALFCFQASREDARISDNGAIVLLKDQDRSKWNTALIERGKYYLERSSGGERLSVYHIEAAIAGCHMRAASFDDTDWALMIELYKVLSGMKPGPIVSLNLAIAIGYCHSPTAGLDALKEITGLEGHYLYHAAMGDFHARNGNESEAQGCYAKASALTASRAEKSLLASKEAGLRSTIRRKGTDGLAHDSLMGDKVSADFDERNIPFDDRLPKRV